MALERAYSAHSSNVFTLSVPGAFSLTRCSLIGSACIHLRSQAVVMAWKATSVRVCKKCAMEGRGGINGSLPNLLPKYFGSIEGGESGSADFMCCCYPFVQTFHQTGYFEKGVAYHGSSRDWMLRTKKPGGDF